MTPVTRVKHAVNLDLRKRAVADRNAFSTVKSNKLHARIGIATGLVVVGDLIGEGSA